MAHPAGNHVPMSAEVHAQRHIVLHAHLDELLADYWYHHRDKSPSNTDIREVMTWSYNQTLDPTPYRG